MGVRVLLADDHPVFRQGLRALLEREKFEVVGEAANGREAVAVVRDAGPDGDILRAVEAGPPATCSRTRPEKSCSGPSGPPRGGTRCSRRPSRASW